MKTTVRHRLLLLNSSAEPFGSERALVDLACELRGVGHQVLIAVPEDGPAVELFGAHDLDVAVCDQLPVLRRSQGRRAPLDAAAAMARPPRQVVRLARDFGPTVVYSNTTHTLAGPGIARAVGCAHVWHVREIERAPQAARRAWGRILLASGVVIAISRAVARALFSPGTLRRNLDRRIHVAHDGIAVDTFSWSPAEVPDGQRPTVVLPGRITPWKGQDVAARAVIAAALPVVLEIIGTTTTVRDAGWSDDVIRPLVTGSDRVKLRGPVDTPADIYRDATFLLQASTGEEPFGRTVVEAMASGVIPIVSDRGGPIEVVRDARDGFVYRHGDESALLAAIERAASTAPGELADMSRDGRQRVMQCFTAARNAQQISTRVLAPLGAQERK